MRVAFLDRDGTINKDYSDEKWRVIKEPEILEGSIEGLKYLKRQGFEFIIVTNQYIIGDGYITLESYNKFNNKLIEILKNNSIEIIDVFYCPHSKREKCNCNKPKPGLIQQALEKYKSIDMKNSILIGDSKCDEELANLFKLDFYGLGVDCENRIDSIIEISKYIKEPSL
ncbi:D-glycero-alpha-D-manno-heptose-1,7-bisphosphate 7-phosphatase [Miniphocaeibacter massiliensis]|uniref:D-glycero-alpha-D-manno-heptose-1,7-bisphosphate 7-phosphatase n=1 Tax=Miniphocaeibacter massiliensis TaxID=2041841 RepID=UPI000C1BDB4E|nr:HAD-IIIA family hydrolase [Miniphocaeibacter massiliensis]